MSDTVQGHGDTRDVSDDTVAAGDPGRTAEESDRLPRSSRKERTRARLLAAAEAVFGMRGFNDASIVEITQRAGVALGTFYVYFPSKTAIFSYIIETAMADLRDHLREARDGAAPERDRESAVLRSFIAWAAAHPHAYRAARQAEYVDGSRLREWYTAFAAECALSLGGAMDAGSLARTDPEVLAWSLIGMADLLATHWVTWGDGREVPLGQLDTFVEIAMRALGLGEPQAC